VGKKITQIYTLQSNNRSFNSRDSTLRIKIVHFEDQRESAK